MTTATEPEIIEEDLSAEENEMLTRYEAGHTEGHAIAECIAHDPDSPRADYYTGFATAILGILAPSMLNPDLTHDHEEDDEAQDNDQSIPFTPKAMH